MSNFSAHSLSLNDLGRNARKLRVDTLVRLRWLAVAGQLAAVLLVRFGFGFALPLNFCLVAIGASAALNIGLRCAFSRTARLEDRPAAALLGFDLLQLAALLYLTGGLDNPFAILILAPIAIAAVSLPRFRAVYLLALMIAVALALSFFHFPLPWKPEEALSLPGLYREGVWVALSLGGVFVVIYASRVAEEARLLSDALAATELVLAREQHLSQLDGLAAAAAHELGTPLATVALVVKEISKSPTLPPSSDDLDVLTQQVQRCRAILGTLTSLGHDTGGLFETLTLNALLEEIIHPHRDFGIEIAIEAQGVAPEPVCARNPGISYGLGNLVENAVDFARNKVALRADWTEISVRVTISDDGPGFAPDILTKLGDPYVTTRSAKQAQGAEGIQNNGDQGAEGAVGLGLGLFIAKTLLERSGARLRIFNKTGADPGARIVIEWPRKAFERAAD